MTLPPCGRDSGTGHGPERPGQRETFRRCKAPTARDGPALCGPVLVQISIFEICTRTTRRRFSANGPSSLACVEVDRRAADAVNHWRLPESSEPALVDFPDFRAAHAVVGPGMKGE